jgi:16S rRNA (guanine966-N2)-methyltransferase
MRIISGIYKGRNILVPKGIRPTKDNVKESLFNILAPFIGGCRVLDLFSGSGAFGIEALSRQAKEIVFVDKAKPCTDIIESNIRMLSPDNEVASIRIINKDAYASIRLLHGEKKRFDIIFIDPPYNKFARKAQNEDAFSRGQFYKNRIRKCLKYINLYDILCHSGLVIIEHFKKDIVPEESGILLLFRRLCYGDTVISIYKQRKRHDQDSGVSR